MKKRELSIAPDLRNVLDDLHQAFPSPLTLLRRRLSPEIARNSERFCLDMFGYVCKHPEIILPLNPSNNLLERLTNIGKLLKTGAYDKTHYVHKDLVALPVVADELTFSYSIRFGNREAQLKTAGDLRFPVYRIQLFYNTDLERNDYLYMTFDLNNKGDKIEDSPTLSKIQMDNGTYWKVSGDIIYHP